SDILEKNRDRKNRKDAEKMAIRVKRSISDEGDGQENRIAASSAKCKGNKAGWGFYQGQRLASSFKAHALATGQDHGSDQGLRQSALRPKSVGRNVATFNETLANLRRHPVLQFLNASPL